MPDLPTGTLTHLFTDLEASTRLWQQHPDAMRPATARHDALLRQAIADHQGLVVKTTGDGFHAVFAEAPLAVVTALAAQQSLHSQAWESVPALRVRIGLHTAAADLRDGDYFGAGVNRAARLMAAGHGGQVLLSLATEELARDHLPGGARLRDLGDHRLKDLARPERVFQLCHADLPSDFPPLKSLDNLPNNLPVQITSFVGRQQELAQAKQLLSSTRLLTLTGSGGSGKSRLALQLGAEALDEFPNGVWLVELAPLADPDLVAQAVAAVLSVPESPGTPIARSLIDALRPRHLLLILDNCEHLLDACARLSEDLLRGCPGLKVLASSREGLGILGETAYRVPSLGLPDAQSAATMPAASLHQYDAVRLFLERAEAMRPDFAVTAANAPVVAEVCRRLDGIPLALELAAARVRSLPIEDLARRLDDMFRLLTGGSRTALPRQQTLRALVDWSYNLLSHQEQVLMRRLSVFGGGWTLQAAEEVCGDVGVYGCRDVEPVVGTPTHPHTYTPIQTEDVLDLLGSLVDKSLVNLESGRYRLLETLRQYARDRLFETEEGESVRERHLDCFLGLAEAGEIGAWGAGQIEWLDRLEQEHDNFRTALEWGLNREGAVERGIQLVAALGHYWHTRSYLAEWRAWLEPALARRAEAPPAVQARVLEAAGVLALFFDLRPAEAVEFLSVAAELYGESGDVSRQAQALARLSLAVWRTGGIAQSLTVAWESLALARRQEDRLTLAWVLRWAGTSIYINHDREEGGRLLEEAEIIFREIGYPSGLAAVLWMLSNVEYRHRDQERGVRLLREAIEFTRAVKDKGSLANLLAQQANWESGQVEDGETLSRLEESLALGRVVGLPDVVAQGLEWIAGVRIRQGDYSRAAAAVEEMLLLPRGAVIAPPIVASLARLSYLCRSNGDEEGARRYGAQALELVQQAPEKERIHCLGGLGHAARDFGDYAEAHRCYAQSLRLRQEQGTPYELAQSLEDYGVLAAMEGEHERAARLFGAAEALAQSIDWRLPVALPADYRRAEAAVRAALNEQAFNAAWDDGRAMSLEQAIDFALMDPSAQLA